MNSPTLRPALYALLCLSLLILMVSSYVHSRHLSVQESVNAAEQVLSEEDAALNELALAVEKDPGNETLKSLLESAQVSALRAKIEKGVQRILANKHDIEGYLTAASAFMMARYPSSAMEILTQGVTENPGSALLWMNLGMVELAQNRYAEALSVFREALRIEPNNPHALNNIAFVTSSAVDKRLLDLKEAFAYATRAVEIDPNNPNYIDTLADVQFKRGQKDEAKRLIRQAISLDPNEQLYRSRLDRFEKAQ